MSEQVQQTQSPELFPGQFIVAYVEGKWVAETKAFQYTIRRDGQDATTALKLAQESLEQVVRDHGTSLEKQFASVISSTEVNIKALTDEIVKLISSVPFGSHIHNIASGFLHTIVSK